MLVQVKYYGPTDHRGTRWKVWAHGWPVKWYSRDHEKMPAEDAEAKARDYAARLVGADPETVRRVGEVDEATFGFEARWPEPWLWRGVQP